MAKKVVATKMKSTITATSASQSSNDNKNFHSFMIQTYNTKTGEHGGVGVQGSVSGIFVNIDKKQIPNVEDARKHMQALCNLAHYQVKFVDINSTERTIETADEEEVVFDW